MNTTAAVSTYADRYAQLSAQHAYERRIANFGLSAVIAPYARPILRVAS